MTEAKAFRIKRAQDDVLRLAREWAKAHAAWMAHDGSESKDARLYSAQRWLRHRLEAACHELVARESE